MQILPYVLLGLFGICVGSFLNVLIDRLPKKEKISGRSYCPSCKRTLKWHELIPLFSFFLLKGECSSCKKSISLQYPLVEFTTGALFILTTYIYSLQFTIFTLQRFLALFWLLLIVCCLIVIFVSDLKYFIVPDEITYSAVFLAFIYQISSSFQFSRPDSNHLFFIIKYSVLSALTAASFFLLILIITKGKGMGLGDAKIAFFMGLLLSYPNILLALFITFFSGSLVGLILIVLKKKKMKSKIPLATFLAPATYVAFFWGEEIVNLYVNKIFY